MARILVVDDEKVMVKGIRFNLENEGYEVDVGYNGRQAVDMVRAAAYDLIILDDLTDQPTLAVEVDRPLYNVGHVSPP